MAHNGAEKRTSKHCKTKNEDFSVLRKYPFVLQCFEVGERPEKNNTIF